VMEAYEKNGNLPKTLLDYPSGVHDLVKQVLYDFGYIDRSRILNVTPRKWPGSA